MRFVFDFISGFLKIDNQDVVIEATNDGIITSGDRLSGDIAIDLGDRTNETSSADYGNRI